MTALKSAQGKLEANREPQESTVLRWLVELAIASDLNCKLSHDVSSNRAGIELSQGAKYRIEVTRLA